jgi:hypothetical protein
LRFKRGNGRLTREELRELTVTPQAGRWEKTRVRFAAVRECCAQKIPRR